MVDRRPLSSPSGAVVLLLLAAGACGRTPDTGETSSPPPGGRAAQASGGAAGRDSGSQAASEELGVVRAYVEAFNAADIPAMLALAADDIQWFSVEGAEVATITSGAEALARDLTSYFDAVPGARSEIESAAALGPFVTVHERAYWTREGEERSQASIAVYEVREGSITRVWYFPAVP